MNQIKSTLILVAFFSTTIISAQVVTAEKNGSKKDEAIFEVVEQQPEFPGGMPALMEYLQTNIQYPASAQKDKVKGTVIVRFVVDTDGSISNVAIAKALNPDCDKEAVRVISQMPKWNPGYQGGKPVRCNFSVPVRFVLDEANRTQNTEEEAIFEIVEKQPEYPGGMPALMNFLSKNTKYPAIAQENNVKGTVVARFVVDKDGSVNDVSIVKHIMDLPSIDYENLSYDEILKKKSEIEILQKCIEATDKETIRVISQMPKWTPATQIGKPVRCYFSVPVRFMLQ